MGYGRFTAATQEMPVSTALSHPLKWRVRSIASLASQGEGETLRTPRIRRSPSPYDSIPPNPVGRRIRPTELPYGPFFKAIEREPSRFLPVPGSLFALMESCEELLGQL